MSHPSLLIHKRNIAHQIARPPRKRPARSAGYILAALTLATTLAAAGAYGWIATRDAHEAVLDMGVILARDMADQSSPGIIGFDETQDDLARLGIDVGSITPVAIGGCVAQVETSGPSPVTAATGWLYVVDAQGRTAGIEFTARAHDTGYEVTHLWKAAPVPNELQAHARQDFEAAFGESAGNAPDGVHQPQFAFLTYDIR